MCTKSAFNSLVVQRSDFQIAEARKERAEGHTAILKYFGLEMTSLLFIVQNKSHIPMELQGNLGAIEEQIPMSTNCP